MGMFLLPQGGCAPPAPPASSLLALELFYDTSMGHYMWYLSTCDEEHSLALTIGKRRPLRDSSCSMEHQRASPSGKHILHRSPQKLGTTAEYVPHGITIHMMTEKLAAVLGPPQHRRVHLLQCLQLCYMIHVKQGSKRLSPLNAKSLCTLRFW
jgi:hypothetical protein